MERIELVGGSPDPRVAHMGHIRPNENYAHVPKELERGIDDGKGDGGRLPTSQVFGGANGGEYRLSFHGYAPGYAQVIESPETWHHTPLQIDTWNRDKMSLTGRPFVPGPLPQNSLSPGSPNVPAKTPQDILYSGLLECPVTTRITKLVNANYRVASSVASACSGDEIIGTFGECYGAARKLGFQNFTFSDKTGSSTTKPAGCSITSDGKGAAVVYYNSNKAATTKCGGGATKVSDSATSPVTFVLELDSATSTATITLSGPSSVWFGVGLNATTMGSGAPGTPNGPYTIVVDGAGKVMERRLWNHQAGTVLAPSVKVVSNTVAGALRTVVLTRPMKGATSKHYIFDCASASLPFINAVGKASAFAYHAKRDVSAVGAAAGRALVRLRRQAACSAEPWARSSTPTR